MHYPKENTINNNCYTKFDLFSRVTEYLLYITSLSTGHALSRHSRNAKRTNFVGKFTLEISKRHFG